MGIVGKSWKKLGKCGKKWGNILGKVGEKWRKVGKSDGKSRGKSGQKWLTEWQKWLGVAIMWFYVAKSVLCGEKWRKVAKSWFYVVQSMYYLKDNT